jgi:hypothetical protein
MNTINIPIEFKQINPEDFDSNHYNVSSKEIIEPNEEGYINDALTPILDSSKDVKSTVVINAGVGQGKSYTIIEMATKYALDNNYIVIIAVPYKSLIEQYFEECSNKYPENRVLNTLELKDLISPKLPDCGYGYVPENFEIFDYDIHIMTINALLGNSGEDILFQSKERVIYFNKLRKYCEVENKEIILIFDEIHDGLHNFKEKYLYKLWNFQGLIHKIFILSATFNEVAKEVIKYLAEFTDRKIQIIESERKIIPEKQSRLHLNFYVEDKIQNEETFVQLVSELTNEDGNFDILSYSKAQAIKILEEKYINSPDNSTVNSLLKICKGKINLCYSDIFNNKTNKKYDASKVNVGTNFGTGVSIKKENHSFIIILPKELNIDYLNNKGVFTDGNNSIIQTLARQRTVGDIYLFLPQPAGINIVSLPYSHSQKEAIFNEFEKYKNSQKNPVNYSNINKQDLLLKKVYKQLLNQVKKATNSIRETDRSGMNRLLFPTQEIFNIENGEKYLSQNFFGGDISSFVFWASICNQFLNCKLHSIGSNKNLHLESDNLFERIVEIKIEYENRCFVFDNEFIGIYGDDKFRLMDDIFSFLFNDVQLIIDGSTADKAKIQECKLMILKTIIDENSTTFNLKEDKKVIYHYYLKSSVFYASKFMMNSYNENRQSAFSENTLRVIELFYSWMDFILVLENTKKKRGKSYILPTNPDEAFINLFGRKNFGRILTELIEKDIFLSTGLFPFKDTVIRANNDEKLINYFYSLLMKIIYKGVSTPYTVDGIRVRFYRLEETDLFEGNYYNLLYKQVPFIVL